MQQPPLFRVYPELQENVPWISMGTYPTRVHKLERLGRHLCCPELWIKRDDESSPIYGGNKVRMMEFALADAKRKKRDALLCWGALGSNQVMASCIFGRELGFKKLSVVFNRQPIHDYVRRNLLIDAGLGAQMDYANSSLELFLKLLIQYVRHWNPFNGSRPYLVPLVGSSALSCLGYVNAALELKEQVEQGLLPEPDYIFITVGTGGTMAGLQLGLRMAGLKSKVIGVRVLDKVFSNERIIAWEINRTIRYLARCGCRLNYPRYRAEDVILEHDFFGEEYAGVTEAGLAAMKLVGDCEGLALDTTYTGKTMAALLRFVESGDKAGRNLLFWHTFNSVDLNPFIKNAPDPHLLPEKFHAFFTS
ncbi:MAG: pyridoxal-phosphate dependent enzyme [Candidatus Abyssobacteria bacterium SURF_5]|uniref:Pyridoxal-phosphate dependent enzyme n=1 Tax=Abyssobacteria bacterium (strain SURF_5) TaxID=2093360 RepID=A0A3A4NP07_ABYX5|nr:MAG: pyridoxal-phosphate dependent enzyme [Candidatus Abyssubacteria bacterium SURF_5]